MVELTEKTVSRKGAKNKKPQDAKKAFMILYDLEKLQLRSASRLHAFFPLRLCAKLPPGKFKTSINSPNHRKHRRAAGHYVTASASGVVLSHRFFQSTGRRHSHRSDYFVFKT